jgi:type IV secretion system protein VirD4
MMDEFATLGHMEIMERAAAHFFPGFGIKLWVVLQTLKHLQDQYGANWETFVGNAGVVQLFANGDEETLRYAAGRMEKIDRAFRAAYGFVRASASVSCC